MTGFVSMFGAKLTPPRLKEHFARNGKPFVVVVIADEVAVTVYEPGESDQIAEAFADAGRRLRAAQAERAAAS